MKVLSINDIRTIVQNIGIRPLLSEAIQALEQDLSNWKDFHKSPRHATHYPHGVIELMPCSDQEFFSFKYVNGHPGNTRAGKLSVVAVGMLAEVKSGYPVLLSEMTLLTAFRTAAVTALAARYLAREDSSTLGIIGTGAQAEFQVLASSLVRPIERVHYFDIDAAAMTKFADNMEAYPIILEPCRSISEAMTEADMIITATAAKLKASLITADMLHPGLHIHGLGGDCPGKTELDPAILEQCKIVVEFQEQSRVEGEIQNAPELSDCAELWELVTGKKPGRENSQEITLMDSVGFALEDYSILKLVYRLSETLDIGSTPPIVPKLADPKNLFGCLDALGD